jgi:hypothetical protein
MQKFSRKAATETGSIIFFHRRPGLGTGPADVRDYPDAEPPGQAGRWMIERLKSCQGKVTAEDHIDSAEYL